MDQHRSDVTGVSVRTAGWAAIASGVIGILAFVALMTAVTTRTTWVLSPRVLFFFRAHDVLVAVQFLALIPVAIAFHRLSQRSSPSMSQAMRNTGIAAMLLLALLVLLDTAKVVSDGLYTWPQGVLGVWLLVVSWRYRRPLPRWLRGFGILVGLGLALVGVVGVGLAVVYPEMLKIPAVPQEAVVERDTPLNRLCHQLLPIFTMMGVATLPFWSICTGFLLLRERRVGMLESGNGGVGGDDAKGLSR